MSSTSPQHPTWVFPPGGAPSNNIEQTSSFGPVHLDDSMVLQWTPDIVATTLQLVCFSQSHEWTVWTVAKGQGQPFAYQFTDRALQMNASDLIFCHFYFYPFDTGNSVRWQMLNERGDKVETWSAANAPTSVTTTLKSALSTDVGSPQAASTGTAQSGSTSSASPSSSSSSTTSTTSTTSTPLQATKTASTQSTRPISSQQHGGSGLSPGASAGIGVGVALGVLALVGAAIFFVWRSRKRQNRQGDAAVEKRAFEPSVRDLGFGGEMHDRPRPLEMGGEGLRELPGEAKGSRSPVELSG